MTSYRAQVAEYDLGNLLVLDKTPLDFDEFDDNDPESSYRRIALEVTNHFLKTLWELPTSKVDGTTVTTLPKPSFRLPREKKLPAMRNETRWERFRKLKGIQDKKKSRKIWDEASKSWKPRWGMGRVDSVKDKWVLEVPDNADPYEDQFTKLAQERRERKAKNELQRLRNLSRNVKPGQAPPIGVLAESQGSRNELSRALSIASSSDASMGKFAPVLNSRKINRKVEKADRKRRLLSQIAQPQERKKLKRAMRTPSSTIKQQKQRKQQTSSGGETNPPPSKGQQKTPNKGGGGKRSNGGGNKQQRPVKRKGGGKR